MRKVLCAIAMAVFIGTAAGIGLAQKSTAKDKPEKPDVAAKINTPRPDARKIAFETNEGTWMSVDVSPDGKTVLFDLLGDIYSIPIAGGAAVPLSRGPAYDNHPQFSP